MLVYFGMAVTSVREKSTTFDELSHLTAGYSYWITGDFRLNPESGTLAQQWQALPLVLGGYRFPSLDQEAWRKGDVFVLGYHFLYDQGNDVGAMLVAGRTMTAVLAVQERRAVERQLEEAREAVQEGLREKPVIAG